MLWRACSCASLFFLCREKVPCANPRLSCVKYHYIYEVNLLAWQSNTHNAAPLTLRFMCSSLPPLHPPHHQTQP